MTPAWVFLKIELETSRSALSLRISFCCYRLLAISAHFEPDLSYCDFLELVLSMIVATVSERICLFIFWTALYRSEFYFAKDPQPWHFASWPPRRRGERRFTTKLFHCSIDSIQKRQKRTEVSSFDSRISVKSTHFHWVGSVGCLVGK